MNLVVRKSLAWPTAREPSEIVERKGIGHPDTICDALAESVSAALSSFYLERFGAILHHNVDKVLLCAGVARPRFGGGTVDRPIEIVIAGQATREAGGVEVPIVDLATEACRAWLAAHLHALDARRHVRIRVATRPGSAALLGLFERRAGGEALANDTSCGVGFAPETPLERVVRAVERALAAPETARAFPEIGEDVKVMGVRRGDALSLTVACALVDRHVASLADYELKRARAGALARAAAARAAPGVPIDVRINEADDPAPEGEKDVYLTVTGTSAEAGDDGEVGRGNRANGLITPCRPMSIEAPAGKNPRTHVGKLYNVIAARIAEDIIARIFGVAEARCRLVSRIGRPLREPEIADIEVAMWEDLPLAEVRPAIEEIAREELARADTIWEELVWGAALPRATGEGRGRPAGQV